MEDDDLARFPTSIDEALLAPEKTDVPEAPTVRVRPRTNAIGQLSSAAEPALPNPGDPLYFQCPACRSTLCVPSERLGDPSPAPCGHCSEFVLPPVLFEREPKPDPLPPRRGRFGPLR
jgi:hypothetical protein